MIAPKITFQICSWKAPESLTETLRSISKQARPDVFETLLVNNGFSDEKAGLLLKEFPDINLRIIREPTPGHSLARLTGFKDARGDFIVMLDDDNSLEGDFVSEFIGLIEEYPLTGGIHPLILPKWEVTPPPWVQEIGLLCLSYTANERDGAPPKTQYWPPEDVQGAFPPPGGGMIIHRKIIELYLSSRHVSSAQDRVGEQIAGCQDCRIYEQVQYSKLGALQTSRLVIYHHIPKSRCTLSYLLPRNYYLNYYVILFVDDLHKQHIGVLQECMNFVKSLAKYSFLTISGQKPFLYCLCVMARRAGSFSARVFHKE